MGWSLLGATTRVVAVQGVEIRYHKDVWPCDPKQGIQFVSPTEGWLGVRGITFARGKPAQPYLLTTTRGPDDLHPVASLQLPPEHSLDSFFFLDRQFGWLAASEMKAGGGPTRLWRTQDGGQTWQELAHNLSPAGGRLQFVSPTVGWRLGGGGLWRTDDGGMTWRQLPLPPGQERDLTGILLLSPTEAWVTGKGTIYQTTDGGDTWTLRYDRTHAGDLWFRFLQFPSPTVGWVAGTGLPLAHTTDGGQTWRRVQARHSRMGPFDRFTSLHFLSPTVGVLAGQHNARETVSKAIQRRASPIAFDYYRPYLLVTFDGGRSWSYHDLPIPVGEWSQIGSTLLGINTVDWTEEATGIVEVRLTAPKAKPRKP